MPRDAVSRTANVGTVGKNGLNEGKKNVSTTTLNQRKECAAHEKQSKNKSNQTNENNEASSSIEHNNLLCNEANNLLCNETNNLLSSAFLFIKKNAWHSETLRPLNG